MRALERAWRGHVLIACGLSLVLLAVLWLVDYIPTNDGPNAIVHGYLALHLHDAGKGYDHFLKSNRNVTSRAFGLAFTTLLRLMPWQPALRMTLSLGALLWAWGFFALVAVVDRRRLMLSSLGFATALSWPFYMGFFSYWLASGAALLVLAFAIASRDGRPRNLAVLGAGLVGLVAAHSFVGILVGGLLAGLVVHWHSGAQRRRALLGVAIASAPGAALSVFSGSGSSDALVGVSIRAHPLAATWLGLGDVLAMPARCFVGGPVWRGAVPPLLALIGLVLAVSRARRGALTRLDRALSLLAVPLVVLSLALPMHLRLWNYFSPRLVPFWVTLGLIVLPVEQLPQGWARRVAHALCVAFALAALGWSGEYHLALAAHEADGLAVADAPIRRSGTRLPLKLTPSLAGIAYCDSGVNIPLLYTISQGGMVPDLFATQSGIHPHLYRAPVNELFPEFPGRFYGDLYRSAGRSPTSPPRGQQLTWLAMLGAEYDDVILISDPLDADVMIGRGYLVDYRLGQAAILRYAGCGLHVDVKAPGATTVPVLVEYGWSPILKTAARIVLPIGTEPESAVADFPRAPCGPIWVRVSWDNDHSGTPSAGDGYCHEADAQHVVAAVGSARHLPVECTVTSATEARQVER